jgi:hypothetical protein
MTQINPQLLPEHFLPEHLNQIVPTQIVSTQIALTQISGGMETAHESPRAGDAARG